MSSQLMTVLVCVLVEIHTPCTPEWVGRFCELDRGHRSALDADVTMGPDEGVGSSACTSSFRRRRSSGAATSAGQGTATRACTRYWGITAGTTVPLFSGLFSNFGQELGTDAGHAGDAGRREVRAAYFFCYAGGA